MEHVLSRRVREVFTARYGSAPALVVHAPGRINLIGEHTDYNHGLVLPGAISNGVWMAFGKVEGDEHDWYAADSDEGQRMPVSRMEITPGWAGYFQAAYQVLAGQRSDRTGVQCVFASDLPAGAGLSSSSALTSGFLLGLDALFDSGESRESLAWLAHRAEHDLIGLEGGIMDQHACLLCRSGHFLLLDCLDRSYEHLPFSGSEDDMHILLLNTHVKHKLTDTDYNTRARECRDALGLLREAAGIDTLREIMGMDLDAHAGLLGPELLKRVRFVQNENQRVLEARGALLHGEWDRLGALLYASHSGLRDDYAVSCPELDFLVSATVSEPSVLGARMMGGGFGGCTINLVRGTPSREFMEGLLSSYTARFGQEPGVITVTPSEAATLHLPG